MMGKKSTFGKDPDHLKRLLAVGLEEEIACDKVTTASLEQIMEKPGGQIGRYKLLSVLGEGGMGVVYLAEQERLIKRRVALKVIKPGMDSKRVIARFEAERQALALLDHPNIAHVYDAGTTETGRPYFVMEYVKGLPITEYCDHHKLTIENRLNLFRQVCLAVHHAHQKGIIHRDIKPSNILVSLQDNQAIPKIIDFGVAKAISRPLTERTLLTEDSQLLGTPEYMSPEQADMVSEDIDTRSDIYSLGVLLYVLLTGVLPFDSDTLRTGGIEHIRQVIRETDPKTPSTRLTRLGEEATKVAEKRRTEVTSLAKCLHRELEWIPLKAMRKERAERYRSVSELADDIENYLNDAPLIAGPPSTIYRLKKTVRRHKALVGGAASVLVVLVAGIIVSIFFAVRADRANANSQVIANFLTNDLLASVSKIKGREATVADILYSASKSLEGKFQDQPLVEADICWTLGMTYRELGDHRASIPYLERSYQLRRERFGEHKSPTPYTKNYLALAYLNTGRHKEAERLLDELIEDPVTVKPSRKCNLAGVYKEQGRYEEAERLFVEGLAASKDWDHQAYLPNLAEVYLYQGQYEKVERLLKEMDERQDREGILNPGIVVSSKYILGRLYTILGRYDESDEQFKKGIEYGNHELPGKDHPSTLRNVNGLAVLRTKQKKYEEAERLFHEALEARKLKLGDDHPHTLETKNDLAVLYKEQAKYQEAEKLLLEAVEGRRLKLGDKHPHTVESLKNLIELYEVWNKPEMAEQWRAKLPREQTTEK
jgi:serine/threonine protein kinase